MSEENKNLWSKGVETHWHPPEGFFEQAPEKIAEGLKGASDGAQQAMDRLNFYINRAGEKLSDQAKAKLEDAKAILHNLYNK
jgi:hypothetical protein